MNPNPSFSINNNSNTDFWHIVINHLDQGIQNKMDATVSKAHLLYIYNITPISADETKFLKKKYKQSSNKVYHDFYKTKMCPLFNLV